ncbi:cation diffusion facilitator family transporter [Planosporangium flavigriseum]|uniref:Cation diffusion facilitator transporter n=1 Tax=Planosporangium flavigriseum TaxID=373681 RepID=A0A8J3LKK6_9ACTN|nr:cation diffusion facilitator family transporter [Planosporangium flavigriseum]GIG74918.1 cation diffusion facilitator transporter [Planosporangium flavigriseum]
MSGADRFVKRQHAGTESAVTVIVAGVTNLAVALAKAIGGAISGSTAMQAEAAHSVADTVTEIFLLIAARRGGRGPDIGHPFGYGRETYLWAFLAALATFGAGAGFSITRGVSALLHGEAPEPGSPLVAYAILVLAFLMEGGSLLRGLWQARRRALRTRLPLLTLLRVTADTPVKAVIFEDAAAMIGIAIAGAGLALWQVTGNAVWDGVASIAVGALLVVVAMILARTNLSLLTGQTVSPRLRDALRRELESLPGVQAIPVFVAVVIGPSNILVAAKVNFADEYSAADIERVADRAEERLRARYWAVQYVFLDPTPSRHDQTQTDD